MVRPIWWEQSPIWFVYSLCPFFTTSLVINHSNTCIWLGESETTKVSHTPPWSVHVLFYLFSCSQSSIDHNWVFEYVLQIYDESSTKNHIEHQTSPKLVMIIANAYCWFLKQMYRSTQLCSLLNVEQVMKRIWRHSLTSFTHLPLCCLLALPHKKRPKGGLWNGPSLAASEPNTCGVSNLLLKWCLVTSDSSCKVVSKIEPKFGLGQIANHNWPHVQDNTGAKHSCD